MDAFWLSYEPENEVAGPLYRLFGFVETGETEGLPSSFIFQSNTDRQMVCKGENNYE